MAIVYSSENLNSVIKLFMDYDVVETDTYYEVTINRIGIYSTSGTYSIEPNNGETSTLTETLTRKDLFLDNPDKPFGSSHWGDLITLATQNKPFNWNAGGANTVWQNVDGPFKVNDNPWYMQFGGYKNNGKYYVGLTDVSKTYNNQAIRLTKTTTTEGMYIEYEVTFPKGYAYTKDKVDDHAVVTNYTSSKSLTVGLVFSFTPLQKPTVTILDAHRNEGETSATLNLRVNSFPNDRIDSIYIGVSNDSGGWMYAEEWVFANRVPESRYLDLTYTLNDIPTDTITLNISAKNTGGYGASSFSKIPSAYYILDIGEEGKSIGFGCPAPIIPDDLKTTGYVNFAMTANFDQVPMIHNKSFLDVVHPVGSLVTLGGESYWQGSGYTEPGSNLQRSSLTDYSKLASPAQVLNYPGTWALVDKVFESKSFQVTDATNATGAADIVSSYSGLTVNSSHPFSGAIKRSGHSVWFRIVGDLAQATGDTTVTICQLQMSNIGANGLWTHYIQGDSDGGEGIFMVTVSDTGVVSTIDVIKTNGDNGSVAAGNTIRISDHINLIVSAMYDNCCNQFIWKRIS